MSVRLRVGDATPTSLCDTCRQATIIEGAELHHRRVLCGAPYPGIEIQWPVKRCTDYDARGTLSFEEMKKIAWVLDLGPRRVGFIKPADLTGKQRQELHDLPTPRR